MDPPAMMHDGAFQPGNAAPFNFAEIWPFPINGADSGGGLDLRRMQFAQFAENASMNRDGGSGGDPMVLDQRGGPHGSRKRRDAAAAADEDDSGKIASTSTGNGVNNSDGKRIKTGGDSMDEKHDPKAEGEVNSSKQVEKNKKAPEPPKQDYIHVRARRGQATDSHSLAERARREKISERMKILQDLVPGCNKVIGKALVLDEIINYVQSLQRQVEFLSMKLEAVNSRAEPGIEEYPPKDFGRQTYDTSGVGFSTQGTSDYGRGSSPEWLHMQLGGGFERTS